VIGIEITVFAFITCATPGPINILASISGSQNGLRANFPFVLGATSGLSLVIIAAGFGISQLLQTNVFFANALTLLGSGYMLYLVFVLAKSNVEIDTSISTAQAPNFYQGSILQIINPKAWLVSMAGALLYLNVEEYFILLMLYVLIFFIVCFFSVFLWVYLGRLVATKIKSGHLNIFNRCMAGVLAILVLSNLFKTFSMYFM